MGARDIDGFLEQWGMDAKALRRRMILGSRPRERERWYALLLLAQGWTGSATAEALERDPHTIGRLGCRLWRGRAEGIAIRADWGFPPPLARRNRRS